VGETPRMGPPRSGCRRTFRDRSTWGLNPTSRGKDSATGLDSAHPAKAYTPECVEVISVLKSSLVSVPNPRSGTKMPSLGRYNLHWSLSTGLRPSSSTSWEILQASLVAVLMRNLGSAVDLPRRVDHPQGDWRLCPFVPLLAACSGGTDCPDQGVKGAGSGETGTSGEAPSPRWLHF